MNLQDPIFRSATSNRLLEMLNMNDSSFSDDTPCKKKDCCKKYKRKGKHCKKCPKI
ncbi:hypothetical protein [Flammeovirga kamogawensis]|uniref:Uncharacterized protein n=1 Tax=Flammeovirga kamogawensis TaxID=373891 RepID=A0ABX8GUY2_9BACT|nr:hypothetical protein [Flammeovirga kamogawensis]MBB6461666.1 ferric iron reductase protein FhuF [Flammeovirga kamogawensis]QWG07408.1 hypothetical protein KM029_00245 [Flammeovirga kamogawensis]